MAQTWRRVLLGCLLGVSAAGFWPAPAAAFQCVPEDRPLDGSCYAPLDRGRAGSTFIRVDGFEPRRPAAPLARELSNLFLAQDPIPGIGTFETVLIPPARLVRGQHPQGGAHGYPLNQLAVAFAQALTHDLTKVRIGFSPAAITDPDFQLAATDPLCQKIAETSPTTIYYFPCTAASTVNADATVTVSLADATRYTFVDGATWTYFNGPFAVTVPQNKFTHRRSSFPLAATLVPDDAGATSVPVNDVSSFLDLSIIYANNTALNTFLRASDGSGRMRTAADGEIPFGPGAPNDCGAFDEDTNAVSASGDARVDENLYLDAVHSLFFRNHNRDALWVAAHRPELTTDEQRFQRARAINIARFQQQVYRELLPALFGQRTLARHLGPYRGYDPGADPRISSTFDIALRVGHGQVLLPPLVFSGGAPVRIEGTLGFPSHSRPNCLFTTFREVGAVAVMRGAMGQSAQAVTGQVSDLMRNIVFRTANAQNTAGFNLDIEQLNIIRGREFGTPNFDALREHWRGASVYELPGCRRAPEADSDPLRCFEYVTDDRNVAKRLRAVYGHVDRIDAFIGLMLEQGRSGHDDHLHDDDGDSRSRFPETAAIVILEQLRRTRAADRWFYLNADNPALAFSAAERRRINETVAESLAASYGMNGIRDAFAVPRSH
jgi:hypothetical protein